MRRSYLELETYNVYAITQLSLQNIKKKNRYSNIDESETAMVVYKNKQHNVLVT